MYKVSIVVPIFIIEKNLKQCLESIVNQTIINDLEVILVDGCSTDNNSELCDEYAQKYKNIKVIHKRNQSLGSIYNIGISLAKGDYIGFVEPNDWIEKNMYEVLYNNAVMYDADFVKGGLYYYSDKNKKNDKPYLENKILKYITQNVKQPFSIFENDYFIFYHSSVWAGIYKSDLIKNVKYPEQRDNLFQDFLFTIKLLLKAKRIVAVNEYFYHLCMDLSEKPTDIGDYNYMRILDQIILARDFLIKENMFEQVYSAFYKQSLMLCYYFYRQIYKRKFGQEFYNRMYLFFSDIKKENLYKLTQHFKPQELKFLCFILRGEYGSFKFENW